MRTEQNITLSYIILYMYMYNFNTRGHTMQLVNVKEYVTFFESFSAFETLGFKSVTIFCYDSAALPRSRSLQC